MFKFWFFAIGWLLLVVPLGAQEAPEEKVEVEKHKTGHYRVEMPGAWAMTYMRAANDYGSKLDPDKLRRASSGELKWLVDKAGAVSFEVHVPDSYQPGKPHGVIAYISASPKGKFPYAKILGDHNLIAVSANNSGNETGTLFRHTYAVQAIEMIAERYDVDRDRIYVSGTSGGGRAASQVMLMNSDTFTGGVPLIGANPCIPMRNAASTDKKSQKTTYYNAPGMWKKPNRKMLTQAAELGRYVFMTGEKDFNRANVKAVFEGYQKAGFAQVHYIEQPGLAHRNPSAELFGKAIDLLDAPLHQAAEANYAMAKKKQESEKLGEAMSLYLKAAMHGKEAEWSSDAMDSASELREQYDTALAKAEEAISSSDKKAFKNSVKELGKQWSVGANMLKELKKRFSIAAKAAAKAASK